MGREHGGEGKRLYVYFAPLVVTVAVFCGCAAIGDYQKSNEAKQQLHASEALLKQGQFEQSLQKAEVVLDRAGRKPPADQALYTIGLTYAHRENPNKDYPKAITSFDRLVSEFPQSPLADQAETWATVLREIEAAKIPPPPPAPVAPLIPPPKVVSPAEKQIQRGNQFLRQEDIPQALKAYETALVLSPQRPPGDEALYGLGLIFAHYSNPNKDYGKALEFFKKVTIQFPQSSLADQAVVWIDVLQTIEKAKQVDLEVEEMKKETLGR